jgi:hypothetical protein
MNVSKVEFNLNFALGPDSSHEINENEFRRVICTALAKNENLSTNQASFQIFLVQCGEQLVSKTAVLAYA